MYVVRLTISLRTKIRDWTPLFLLGRDELCRYAHHIIGGALLFYKSARGTL